MDSKPSSLAVILSGAKDRGLIAPNHQSQFRLSGAERIVALFLRTLSDRELIQFGRELRKKCFKPKEDRCWKELQLARDEWRNRHPKPPRPRR